MGTRIRVRRARRSGSNAVDLCRPSPHVVTQAGRSPAAGRAFRLSPIGLPLSSVSSSASSSVCGSIRSPIRYFSTLGRGHAPPARAFVVKASMEPHAGQLDVLGSAVRHRPKTLLGRRVERLKRSTARRLHPLAVDQQTTRLANEVLNVLRQALGKGPRGNCSVWRWTSSAPDAFGQRRHVSVSGAEDVHLHTEPAQRGPPDLRGPFRGPASVRSGLRSQAASFADRRPMGGGGER